MEAGGRLAGFTKPACAFKAHDVPMPNRIRTDRSATRCFFIRIGSDSARTSPQSLYRAADDGSRASATERTHGHRSPECAKDARHRAIRNDGYSCGVLLNGGHEDEYVFRPFQ